tara:strand:- start:307 stop:465 length:159 start_codon:yes stop_codon:yes gene_type:complete
MITDKLKHVSMEIQAAIWKYTDGDGPPPLIDEMKEALNHISKAIDILEWDEL